MTGSSKRSRRIVETQHAARRVILSLEGLIGRATAPPWLVVPDSSTVVRGAHSNPGSPSRRLLQGAVGGLFVCVVSETLRREVTEVLQRPYFGYAAGQIETSLEPFWAASRFVDLAPPDPAMQRYVRDPKDIFVIQTAAATFSIEDLNALPVRMIVSSDEHDIPRGRNWANFRCCSANEFWHALQEASPDRLGR